MKDFIFLLLAIAGVVAVIMFTLYIEMELGVNHGLF